MVTTPHAIFCGIKVTTKKSLHFCHNFREILEIITKQAHKKIFVSGSHSFSEIPKNLKLIMRSGTNGQSGGTSGKRHKNGNVPAGTRRVETLPRPVIFEMLFSRIKVQDFYNRNQEFFSKQLSTFSLKAPNCIFRAAIPATTFVLAFLLRHAWFTTI